MISRPILTSLLVRAIKRLTGVLKPMEGKGVWYRYVLGRMEVIICLLECEGDIYGGEEVDVDIGPTLTFLREEDQLARKTFIHNTGPKPVLIYEAGIVIGSIEPGVVWESPVSSRLVLEASGVGGDSSVIVTTHRRCECGIERITYEEINTPIGGHLL